MSQDNTSRILKNMRFSRDNKFFVEKYSTFLSWKLNNKELLREEKVALLKNMMLEDKKSLTWEEVRTTLFSISEKNMDVNLHKHICHE
jgi:hypothetical protein